MQVRVYLPPYLIFLDWGNMGPCSIPTMQCCRKRLSAILKRKSMITNVITLVMDVRVFLSSKAAESSEQEANQTTKTPTLKRGSDDIGSSTSIFIKMKICMARAVRLSMAHI